jgi:MFS family permease
MDRSLWAVLAGTFTLRFSTGLTGLMLTFYLAHLDEYHGVADQVLGLGQGQPVGPIAFAMIHATFYAAELVFSPLFGVLSDRLGHHRVMQFGPVFGIVAVIATWATTNLPVIGATRLLEGCATAASVPSILGFIAAATATDEGLRGRAVARFEAATLAGLLSGFVAASVLFAVFGPLAFLLNAALYAVSLAIYRYGVDPKRERAADEAVGAAVAPAGSAAGELAAARASDASVTAAGPASSVPRPAFSLERYRAILTGTHVWLLAPTWIAINAVLGLFTTQTIFQMLRQPDPRFLDQQLMGRVDELQVGLGLAVGGVLFFAGLIYWGNRFKALRRTTIILYGLGGGALLVLGAVAINHSGGLPDVARLAFAVPIVLGVFVLAGATPAAIGLLADVTEAYPDDRGAIMGLYSVFLGLGQIIGSLIAGFAANAFGLDGVLVASLVLLAIAVVPLGSLRRYEHYLGPERAEVLGQTQ